jgi:uncharacterized protein
LARIRQHPFEPLFVADWDRVLMMHFEVEAEALQRIVPFELDLRDGRAFVSLVAFTMRGMRPRLGGKLTSLFFRPIATHDFLNVRTYVRQGGEPGIHFLAEWVSNWLAVKLGPTTFGLPYHLGRIRYQHDPAWEHWHGCVEDADSGALLKYHATHEADQPFAPCAEGSLDEWLMERYTAYNGVKGRRYFRVWHPPWPQCRAEVTIETLDLLLEQWPFFKNAGLIGANLSPGVTDVWLGRPHRL